MNKKISFIILIALLAMFSISAASASDENVTDALTTQTADEIPDVSLETGENSSDVTDIDENSSAISTTDEEVLEIDSDNVILNAGKVTMNSVLAASNNVKNYYNNHGVLPNTVNVGSTTFTIHEFYYLMSKATALLAKSDYSMIDPITGVKGPSSKCTDTVYSAAVTYKTYVAIANEAVSYISKNRKVANYVNTVAGKIAYEDYVLILARALAYQYNNGELPNYVSFYSNDPSKVKYDEEGELNAFGLYGKKVWIDADGGSDAIKWKIANALKELGWDVYVGDTYANAHWEDYLNAKPGYVLINIYNGFCAGTMRELVSDSIQSLLKTKHVVCVPVWDTSGWTEGMAPYRYGDFSGYSAKRAWDDDFSPLDPSIEDVDDFFRFYGVTYCAGPTVEMIIDQFVKGGYYASKGETGIFIGDILTAAASLNDALASGLRPEKISVGGTYYSTPQFLYLMASATVLIDAGKLGTRIQPVSAAAASGIAHSATGQLPKSQYVNVASEVARYISTNNRAPGYVSSNLGKIGYSELVDAFSRILTYYKNHDALPNQVLIQPGTNLVAKYENKNIVATVKDNNGKAVKGIKVGFAINGKVNYVVTDANGQAKYSLANWPENVYTATVRAYGNDAYADSNKNTITFNTGDKEQVKIYLRNALYFALETKIVQVTLWDSHSKPLAGKTVHIELNEYGLKYTGVTDKNGDAFIRVGVGFGVHEATVSFDGDGTYYTCSKTGSIRVIKETPSVMVRGVDSEFKVRDNPKIVKVHLRDRYDKPLLENSKIIIKMNGVTYIGFTDANGIASIKIDLNKAGTFNAQVMYGGNSAYNAVTRDIKIVVK